MNSNPTSPENPEQRTGEFAAIQPAIPSPLRGLDRLAVPGPRPLLAGILVARLLLVTLALVQVLAPGWARDERWLVVLVAIAAILGSGWLAHVLRRGESLPGPWAIVAQAAIDTLVVTAMVSVVDRDAATPVAALYVALVTLYALLLPVRRGLLVVAFATLCYVAVTLRFTGLAPGATFWTQLGVIAFVGCLIAVLGNRLAGVSVEQAALAAALQQARLEADEILATIQSGVISVDGEGRLGFVNPRARRLLGATRDTFVAGQPVMETLRSRSRELHDAIQRGIVDGARVARGEAVVRRGDGSLFPVGLSTTTFQRPGNAGSVVTAIFTDISGLKKLQEFRLRAERLEAVAALSASLAHEIRNPLAAIRSAVEQLARGVDPDDEDEQTLARLVMRESERLNRLLSEFLDFSRVRATKFEHLDLLDVAQDAARVVGERPDARGVEIIVTGSSTELEADADLLHRIASNLILNAAQALDGRGLVAVTVGSAEPGEGPASLGEHPAKLVIRDNGPGIPEPVRERLFEPFVTGRQGGTGLGLAIVQRAVAAHGGIILVDSAPRAGTTFSIFLPATWDREDRA
ncbi:MAG: ATP-binding protein [Gemmatimonadota bacterium]